VRPYLRVAATLLALGLLQGCAAIRRPDPPAAAGGAVRGNASWYGQEYAGRATANGEIFDPMLMTAAHRTLPFGTVVEVHNLTNGRTVRVRINDRGPFIGGRIIDLSYAAARQIGLIEPGVGPVEVRIIGREAVAPAVAPPRIPVLVEQPAPEIDFPLPSEPVRAADPLPARSARREGFVVQLGAFAREENAQALLRRVAPLAPSARIEQSGSMHRVRVGPFSTRDEALALRDSLELSGFTGIVVGAGE
jgi:rare lipoprotein A